MSDLKNATPNTINDLKNATPNGVNPVPTMPTTAGTPEEQQKEQFDKARTELELTESIILRTELNKFFELYSMRILNEKIFIQNTKELVKQFSEKV